MKPCDVNTARSRNVMLENNLRQQHYDTVDVVGDGNCFYRAVSYLTSGHENNHSAIRQLVADHIQNNSLLSGVTDISPDDGLPAKQHIEQLHKHGVAVGEDAILAVVDLYNKELHVYSCKPTPLVYKPRISTAMCDPLRLAFYEPGHYRAVILSLSSHLNVGGR